MPLDISLLFLLLLSIYCLSLIASRFYMPRIDHCDLKQYIQLSYCFIASVEPSNKRTKRAVPGTVTGYRQAH
jgi:hypothetical protein